MNAIEQRNQLALLRTYQLKALRDHLKDFASGDPKSPFLPVIKQLSEELQRRSPQNVSKVLTDFATDPALEVFADIHKRKS